MNYKLLIWRATEESILCERFLTWQKIKFDRYFGIDMLRKSGGVNKPVLQCDGEVVAIGFFNVLKHFQENGHVLC